MPNREAEARIRAAYRARACACALAVGAQVYVVGAGIGMPLCLNAAYMCVLPSLALVALAVVVARRRLARGARLRQGWASHALYAFLALVLALCAAFLVIAAAMLGEHTILPQARAISGVLLTLAACAVCMLPGAEGVERLCFALRWVLPGSLLLLAGIALFPGTVAGLFPILGTGLRPLGLGALCTLGAAAPAAMLLLPPPTLVEREEAHRCMPGVGFFLWRALAGGGIGVLLLLARALCCTYETLAGEDIWGARMLLMSSFRPREGIAQAALALSQVTALALAASALLGAARQALCLALPKVKGWQATLVLLLPLTALVVLVMTWGAIWALRAAPFFALGLLALMLFEKKM